MIELKPDPYNKHQKTVDEYIEIWNKLNNDFKFGIRTYTGKEFAFTDINLDMICIEDIAHALSNQCRFGGHVHQHYSVAQHCLWVARQADIHKLEGLLHDATETYLIDVPKPIKALLPQYSEYEEILHEIISKKFNLVYPYPEEIHQLDKLSMVAEWDGVMINNYMRCLTPGAAEKRFLEMYNQLKR